MKKLVLGLFSFAIAAIMVSCQTTPEGEKMTIASKQGDCVGVAPQKCMLVKIGEDSTWTFFYDNIEGFTYEAGYEYELVVKKEKRENVPADASAFKYTLVKEVSKTQKESENLPASVQKPIYRLVGKVLSVETKTMGRGAAEGQFEVQIVKVEVSTSEFDKVKANDVIHCELVASPKVKPEVGREYVFKAKNLHPAHALGVYMLDTDVMDLI